jgi:glycosyltransferase involved in cell wall biosynthesis
MTHGHVLSGTGSNVFVQNLCRAGQGGPAGPLEHVELSEALLREARGIENGVEFVGLLGHDQLARLLPAAGVGVVLSIFPETFGPVAAELSASGVFPFATDHSRLREADGVVSRGLSFEVRVGFEENPARPLTEYLVLPENERRCGEVIRRKYVEYLSWGTPEQRLVQLVEVKG